MNSLLQTGSLLDPLFLAVTSLGMAVLAIAVYRSNKHSATNILFIFLSISILLWLWSGYMAELPEVADYVIVFHRLAIFFAAPMSALFFLLAYTIPGERILMKKRNIWIVVILTIFMMVINISPYAFVATASTSASDLAPGPGILPFGIISTVFSLLAIYYLFKKYSVSEKEQKIQLRIVLIGIFSMILLIIGTILIPIIISQSLAFLPFLPLYALIFLGLTGYAITQYRLFNIKIILTEVITIVIWITLFAKIFIDGTLFESSVDGLIFLVTLVFGISLIRSVRKEIEQRVKIQSLADDLSKANENQVALIHFITHQVKGFFTKSRNIFSLLTEGEAGPLSPEMLRFVNEGFDSDTKGVAMVQDVLNAANIRSGIVKYELAPFDLSTLVGGLVVEYKKMAEGKGLQLTYGCWGTASQDGKDGQTASAIGSAIAAGAVAPSYMVNGDMEQLRQVFKNLIENSIHYTPQGSVNVRLSQSVADSAADHTQAPKIVFSVRDTGVGLTDDDKALLFTQGGKGIDSTKVNVESTGYGLFIAKGIVEAHHGRIWAESEGRGKGSGFFVELPGVA